MADTPTLAQVIRDAIEARLAEVHTSIPAQIVSFDDATCLATVQPCLKRKYTVDNELVDLPKIVNVPVVMPRGGGAVIMFDLQPGDYVLLVFAERSIDKWITSGGKVDPKDPRKHQLSDAFAIPGGYPKSVPPTGATCKVQFSQTGVMISNSIGNFVFEDNADITFDTGTVQGRFGNGGKVAFENAIGELIAALHTILTTATAGGFPLIIDPTAAATLTAFKE